MTRTKSGRCKEAMGEVRTLCPFYTPYAGTGGSWCRAGGQSWLCCRPAHLPTISESNTSPGAGRTGFSSVPQPWASPWPAGHRTMGPPPFDISMDQIYPCREQLHMQTEGRYWGYPRAHGWQPWPDPCTLAAVRGFFFHLYVPQLVRLCSSCRVRLFVLFAVK